MRHLTRHRKTLVGAAKALRLAPPVAVDVLGAAPRDNHFTLPGRSAIGADLDPKYPTFSRLSRRFAAAIPSPKLMRVDTAESYVDFRNARRAPYADDLRSLVAVVDEDDMVFDAPIQGAVLGAVARLRAGGQRIALPSDLRGKAAAWQDGPEVLVTICVPAKGGLRYLTSGGPLSRYADELAIAADEADLDATDDVLGAFGKTAQALGAASLVSELCRAYPKVVGCDRPVLGLLSSEADPKVAAYMALLQLASRGDTGARAEIALMLKEGLENEVYEAAQRLAEGQVDKAASKASLKKYRPSRRRK